MQTLPWKGISLERLNLRRKLKVGQIPKVNILELRLIQDFLLSYLTLLFLLKDELVQCKNAFLKIYSVNVKNLPVLESWSAESSSTSQITLSLSSGQSQGFWDLF